MARSIITAEQWARAKEYFESGVSLSEIENRTNITKGAISKKSVAEKWVKGGAKKQLIAQAVEVRTAKETILNTAVSIEVHNELVDEATRHLTYFKNAALRNQKKADEMLEMSDTISDIEAHSRITARNKETVLGKEPQTVINNTNAQQNVKNELDLSNLSDDELETLDAILSKAN
nr:MAG TPA: InsA C-terminal domain [Caudoviricetes sp.]